MFAIFDFVRDGHAFVKCESVCRAFCGLLQSPTGIGRKLWEARPILYDEDILNGDAVGTAAVGASCWSLSLSRAMMRTLRSILETRRQCRVENLSTCSVDSYCDGSPRAVPPTRPRTYLSSELSECLREGADGNRRVVGPAPDQGRADVLRSPRLEHHNCRGHRAGARSHAR